MKTIAKLMLLWTAVAVLGGCLEQGEPLALGTLERDRVVLTAVASELIVEQPVAEGSAVSRGDLLVRLDDAMQKAVVAQAEAEVQAASAHLGKLAAGPRDEEIAIARARVSDARARLEEAEHVLSRTRTLKDRKVMVQADLDEAVARRTSAAAALEGAEEELRQLLNGTRPEDLQQAEAELQAARARLQQAQIRLDEYRVTASRDGWLDSLPWNVGERVFQGSPLAVVMAGKVPYARVYIPEPHRASIGLGDVLTVRIDGVEERPEGTVRWIASEPAFTPYYALNEEERARLMYLAEVQLPDSAAELPSGLPVQVELRRGAPGE